jgi:hypothetical protein
MLAAFQVGRGDSSIDSFAERCNVPNITVLTYQVYCVTVLELSTGLCPVPVLAPAVLDAVFLTAAAAVHRTTGARAASAILKRSRQKVADWLNSH